MLAKQQYWTQKNLKQKLHILQSQQLQVLLDVLRGRKPKLTCLDRVVAMSLDWSDRDLLEQLGSTTDGQSKP